VPATCGPPDVHVQVLCEVGYRVEWAEAKSREYITVVLWVPMMEF